MDSAILSSDREVGTHARENNTAVMVKNIHQKGLHDILSFVYIVASILATIIAGSCSAQRYFSTVARIKTFLRSTVGQTSLAASPPLSIKENNAILRDFVS